MPTTTGTVDGIVNPLNLEIATRKLSLETATDRLHFKKCYHATASALYDDYRRE